MRIAVLVFCSLLAAASARADSPAVLFVLDASGSMMAKVQGKPKIDIARLVMSDLVRSLDPGVEVGLVSYGHRRKNDCKDIEVVVPDHVTATHDAMRGAADVEVKPGEKTTAEVVVDQDK